jgi:hypothetical protein
VNSGKKNGGRSGRLGAFFWAAWAGFCTTFLKMFPKLKAIQCYFVIMILLRIHKAWWLFFVCCCFLGPKGGNRLGMVLKIHGHDILFASESHFFIPAKN